MRALRLDFSEVPPLALHEIEPPGTPSRGEWLRLRPRLTGICGSDVGLMALTSSMYLAPLLDLPATLGHEILAVDEAGRRVAVDNVLGCEALGRPRNEWCPPCSEWQPQICARFGEDAGGIIGYSDSIGGGWSEEMVAPVPNVFEVPADLPDEKAVLLEPCAISLHGVLLRPVRSPVLVVGAGVIGLAAIAAVQAVAPGADVVALAKHEHQAVAAEALGAKVVRMGRDHVPQLAEAIGARLLGPAEDQPTVAAGYPTVLECVGHPESVDLAFRFADGRGTVVLLGGSGPASGSLDLAPTWVRELQIVGSFNYGYETWEGERVRTFDLLLDLVRSGRFRIGDWLTHTFPLEEHRQALDAVMSKASGALKVAFRP